MPSSQRGPSVGASQAQASWEMERRYSVPSHAHSGAPPPGHSAPPPQDGRMPSASEDLHAWSIYRQNLNSDFTDSALGSTEKSPLPYGNFQLRESTVQSILAHPRYGPKSALGSNMYTYLKFGLPRVFPPSRGGRDGSSGYDSSEDGSARRGNARNLRSARSDPDFRSQRPRSRDHAWAPGPGPAAEGAWRGKSRSEANLLHAARAEAAQAPLRRSALDLRSLHPSPSNHRQHQQQQQQQQQQQHGEDARTRRASKASSHRGQAPPPSPGAAPVAVDTDEDEPPAFRFPHLQCVGLAVADAHGPLLAGLSFEAFGGDVTAVMATSETEGSALLEALSGRRSRLRGDVLLNGQPMRSGQLRSRVAHAQQDSSLAPDLTVAQTLRMARWLRQVPGAGKHTLGDKSATLLEELGLAQVANTTVSRLTASERRRLHVGCQLALDTALVTLDQPTRGMDIFDTFFLVEFLRQWASSGRVVVMTLHPPTYEVFTMLGRVLLLSAGRPMFAGRRRDMLPFFAACDFPCPAFKNPSDYYLDLVTLDDLSAEAMLESSQRIAALADAFARRQAPLADPMPAALPAKMRHASALGQCLAIATRAAVFSQPLTLVRWFALALLAALTSLAIGCVFFALPASDPALRLSDRQGFLNAVSLGAWPLLLMLVVGEIGRERCSVQRDISDGLYSRPAYFVTKTLVNLPPCACVWVAYLLPSYLMAGLHPPGTEASQLYLYLAYWLAYLLSVQQLVSVFALSARRRVVCAGLSLVVLLPLSLASGQWLHPADLPRPIAWLRWAAPSHWLQAALLPAQHSAQALALAALTCRSKQVQHQDIIVQLPCPAPDGAAALRWAGISEPTPPWLAAAAPAAFFAACLLLGGGAFLARRFNAPASRNNPNKP